MLIRFSNVGRETIMGILQGYVAMYSITNETYFTTNTRTVRVQGNPTNFGNKNNKIRLTKNIE